MVLAPLKESVNVTLSSEATREANAGKGTPARRVRGKKTQWGLPAVKFFSKLDDSWSKVIFFILQFTCHTQIYPGECYATNMKVDGVQGVCRTRTLCVKSLEKNCMHACSSYCMEELTHMMHVPQKWSRKLMDNLQTPPLYIETSKSLYMDILALAIHHMIPFSVPQTLQDMGLINVSNRSLTVGWVWTIKSGRIKIFFFGFYWHHISMYISCVKSVFCLGLPFYGI